MFNEEDLAYINAYRKFVMANKTIENKEALINGLQKREVIPFKLITLSDEQKDAVDRAKKYALEQSIQNALRKQMGQFQAQDANIIKQNQALVLLSRIYVGSIGFDIGEEELRKIFSPFGPVKTVILSWDHVLQKHKGFAFVEFDIPESASLALEKGNNLMISGRCLKVGRPTNAPQTAGLEEQFLKDPCNKNRIFIAGVHPELSESDIQTVFEAFGKIIDCSLEAEKFGQPNRHKGYGWIEFEADQAATDAVASMNGFELAGQLLRVGRALTPKTPTACKAVFNLTSLTPSIAKAASEADATKESVPAAAPANSMENTTNQTGFSETVSTIPPPGIFIPTSTSLSSDPTSIQSKSLPQTDSVPSTGSVTSNSGWDEDEVMPSTDSLPTADKQPDSSTSIELPPSLPMQDQYSPTALSPIPPEAVPESTEFSRVILLENMVDPTDLDPELEEEVAEECSKFGNVLRVLVHAQTEVRIFVQFDCHEASSMACQSLNNRFFGGRLVMARLYPDEQFQMRNLDL